LLPVEQLFLVNKGLRATRDHHRARKWEGPARPSDFAGCLDMITGAAARLMRLEDCGIAVSGRPISCVSMRAIRLMRSLWGIKRGGVSFTRSRPQLHPPES
jgi:hypothetical protein